MTRGGSWPTPQQELLLRAALLDGPPAAAAWDAWFADVDIEHLDEGSFRLLPLAYRRATARGSRGAALARLRGVHRQSWYRNQLLFRQVARVVRTFEEAGIDTLLLKGVPLALLHYGDEGSRPMSDADVLVKRADVTRAVQVLGTCGWRPRKTPDTWPPEPRASWPFSNGEIELDLHWRVFSIGSLPDDTLWEASVPCLIRGASTRALAPADQLLHVIVHGLQWNPIPSIRWIADAVVVAARGPVDWDRLIEQATTRRFIPALTLALEYLNRRLDVAVPPDVFERLRARRPSSLERLELWARLSPGVAGAATRLWFDYRRITRDGGSTAGRLPLRDYLQRRWLLADGAVLSRAMARKVAGRWSRLIRRRV
jgi:hypothetical protein